MKINALSSLTALGLLSVAVTGCVEDPFAVASDEAVEPVAPTFRIAAPALPGDISAELGDGEKYVVTDRAELSVTLDGESLATDETDADGRTVVSWTRPPGSRIELRVEWAESIPLGNGATLVLPLATFERSMTIERNTSITIDPEDYAVDAGANGERDQDGDGDGNLLERMTGFSPFNGSTCPENCDPDVSLYVKRVDPRLTANIRIDGSYSNEFNSAEGDGRDDRLKVDEYGSSTEAGGGTGGPSRFADADARPFRFLVMHDDERLYLAVVGDEEVSHNTPWGDSENPALDDSIILFLDTDDPSDGMLTSRLDIPLMGLNTGEADRHDLPTARARLFDFATGSSSLPPDLLYATCVCDGSQQFWELSVPLASLGIVRGRPFGLEVAVNDDSDGGDTVTQWLWNSSLDPDGDVVPALVVAR